MATGFAAQIKALRDFLSHQLSVGRTDLSAKPCFEEFRADWCELEQFKPETQAAIEESHFKSQDPDS